MRAILAIAAAHFRQEWRVALLSLANGLAVLGLVALNVAPEWVPEMMGILGGLSLPSAAAVLMGLNLLGPDLRQRRLSFYFSRPCSPFELWWGRFLGAMGVLAVSWLGGVMAVGPFANPIGVAVFLATLLLVLLLMTNAATCILSSPSWDALLFDLAAASAVLVSAYWSLGRILEVVASPGAVMEVGSGTLVTAAIALVPAGLAYLWGGKGRARWGHRWFSWTFWPIVALSVVGINIWRIHEVRTPLPEILRFPSWGAALDQHRFLLSSWDTHPRSFAVNVDTGAFERVKMLGNTLVQSSNGEFAAWTQVEMPSSLPANLEFSLFVARTASMNEPRRTMTASWASADLSNDGERALFQLRDGLEVRDTRTGDIVGRLPTPASTMVVSARFVDNQSVTAVLSEESVFRLVTFAFNGTVLREERVTRPPRARLVEHTPTGRRAIIEGTQTVLYDRNGKPLGTSVGSNQGAFFTRDGRLVVSSSTRAPYPAAIMHSLSILAGDGSAARILPISGSRMELVGELSTGEIVVRAPVNGLPTSLLVDPGTLTIRATFEGVEPLRTPREFNGRVDTAGHDTYLRVFQNEGGDLFYLDPGAAKLRLLIKSTREDF